MRVPGAAARLAGIDVHDVVGRSSTRTAGESIARAEIDLEVADDRLHSTGRQVRRGASDVPRVGLLGDETRERPALGVVRREQLRAGPAVKHGRKLPREVLAVVNAGVSAVTAIRRHDVRGVARQEDAPLLEAVGNVGHRLPAHTSSTVT